MTSVQAARDNALANLTFQQRYALSFTVPQVGDHVLLTDKGDGWEMTLTGKITSIDGVSITIGNGYSLDAIVSTKIKPAPEPARDVADLIQQVETLDEELTMAKENCTEIWREVTNLQDLVRNETRDHMATKDELRGAERRCDRLRRALAAAGVNEALVELIERG